MQYLIVRKEFLCKVYKLPMKVSEFHLLLYRIMQKFNLRHLEVYFASGLKEVITRRFKNKIDVLGDKYTVIPLSKSKFDLYSMYEMSIEQLVCFHIFLFDQSEDVFKSQSIEVWISSDYTLLKLLSSRLRVLNALMTKTCLLDAEFSSVEELTNCYLEEIERQCGEVR